MLETIKSTEEKDTKKQNSNTETKDNAVLKMFP